MGIIDNARELASTIQKIDNIELYKRILDLQGEIQGLVDENRQLREQVREQQRLWELNQELSFEHNAYWRVNQDKAREGPFCTNCWDSRRTQVRMHRRTNPNYAMCPTCGKDVNVTGVYETGGSIQAPSAWR
jgi:hypothetical protein